MGEVFLGVPTSFRNQVGKVGSTHTPVTSKRVSKMKGESFVNKQRLTCRLLF